MDEYTCFITDSIVSIIVLSLLKQGITIDILGNNFATGSMNAYETSIGLNQFKPGFYIIRSADNKGNQYVAKFLVEE